MEAWLYFESFGLKPHIDFQMCRPNTSARGCTDTRTDSLFTSVAKSIAAQAG